MDGEKPDKKKTQKSIKVQTETEANVWLTFIAKKIINLPEKKTAS